MRKRLFFDTNAMYDFVIERVPFYKPIAQVISLADSHQVTIVTSSLSFATTNYFAAKEEGIEVAKEKIRKFRALSQIAAISESTVDKALASSWKDFEDALQYFSALETQCDIIITRNGKDFKNSELPTMTAEEFLHHFLANN